MLGNRLLRPPHNWCLIEWVISNSISDSDLRSSYPRRKTNECFPPFPRKTKTAGEIKWYIKSCLLLTFPDEISIIVCVLNLVILWHICWADKISSHKVKWKLYFSRKREENENQRFFLLSTHTYDAGPGKIGVEKTSEGAANERISSLIFATLSAQTQRGGFSNQVVAPTYGRIQAYMHI